jgi:hypothetical protein
MKKIQHVVSVVGLAAATVLSGGAFTAASAASSQADCSAAKPASVYTDGLNHFAGVCVGSAYVQVDELSLIATGKPAAQAKTGNAAADALIPVLGTDLVLKPGSATCGANGGVIVIYTDGLNHVLGACDSYGKSASVQEIAGALANRNNLIELKTGIYTATVQTQAQGSSGVIVHPKIVIK